MKCGKCGRDNAESYNYCIHCGAVLERKAVKAARKRMGLFKRILLQLLIIVGVLAVIAFILGTQSIIVVHRNADNAYTAYFAFVGRARLYLTDGGDVQFSEHKVVQEFPEGIHSLRVRFDACHHGLGREPVLIVTLSKVDGGNFTPVATSIKLPDGGCDSDRDIELTYNQWMSPGKYVVRFSMSHSREDTVELKSMNFTVVPQK